MFGVSLEPGVKRCVIFLARPKGFQIGCGIVYWAFSVLEFFMVGGRLFQEARLPFRGIKV